MVYPPGRDPLAPDENDAIRAALSQLARRVRYLETLPIGDGDPGQYAKEWMGEGDTQSIPTDTDTLLYFTENEKTHAGYIANPNTRLTVPSGLSGIHTALAGAVFEGQPEGQRRLWVVVNGEETLVSLQVDAAAGYFPTELNVSSPLWAWEGYWVEAWVWQNSGGDLLVGRVD